MLKKLELLRPRKKKLMKKSLKKKRLKRKKKKRVPNKLKEMNRVFIEFELI